MITGYPCSGKTYRARQLVSELEERIADNPGHNSRICKPTIIRIPSYHSSAPQHSTNKDSTTRDAVYTSAALEKTARAAELSAIKRALSNDTIVIADDLNYIKGFRYQIWCEAKAAGIRCCTVHCAASEAEVRKWNRARLREWAELKGEDPAEEDEETVITDGRVGNDVDAKNILPESHTAIYGDRIPDAPSTSRSSSMDAYDGEETATPPRTVTAEPLTSLSLIDPSPTLTGKVSAPADIDTADLAGTLSREPTVATAFEPSSPGSPPYSTKTLESLLMRYEPPSPFSKWDTPLFTVPACDALPPAAAIWDALFPPRATTTKRKGGVSQLEAEVKPHAATVLPQATGAEALQFLEKSTADVVTQIMTQVKAHPDLACDGGDVKINFGAAVATLSIPAGTILTLPMLQRLRRRFTQIQRGGIAHGQGYVKGETAVGEAFLRFLNAEMGAC